MKRFFCVLGILLLIFVVKSLSTNLLLKSTIARPVLHVESSKDIGTVFYDPNRDNIEVVFPITNNGNAPLFIRRIIKTCSCSSVLIDSKQVLPGETSMLRVNVAVPEVHGKWQTYLGLETNDPENYKVKLTIQAYVKHTWSVYPNRLYCKMEPGESKTFHFDILGPTDDSSFSLQEIISDSELMCIGDIIENTNRDANETFRNVHSFSIQVINTKGTSWESSFAVKAASNRKESQEIPVKIETIHIFSVNPKMLVIDLDKNKEYCLSIVPTLGETPVEIEKIISPDFISIEDDSIVGAEHRYKLILKQGHELEASYHGQYKIEIFAKNNPYPVLLPIILF